MDPNMFFGGRPLTDNPQNHSLGVQSTGYRRPSADLYGGVSGLGFMAVISYKL